MRPKLISESSSGIPIYTLAQSGTQNNNSIPSKVLISGEGTRIVNNPSLANRAKRKVITREVVLAIIDIAKEKGDVKMEKSLWNAYYCQSEVIITDNKLYGKYCKNRFCTICTAIRKAGIINKYYPVLKTWKNPQFVTLTVKSCKAEKLDLWIFGMQKAFNLIHNRCKTRHKRGKGIKLIGIKSLECNFNPKKRTYNPHFHIIVPDKNIAYLLKKEWLKQWRPRNTSEYRYKYADPKVQFIRKVNDINRDLIETIKYGSKVFTEPDPNKKSNQLNSNVLFLKTLYNIIAAMKGKRIFDRFGFNLPEQIHTEPNVRLVENFEKWIFPRDAADWVNSNTGETLTGYTMPIELYTLLNQRINTHLK